MNKHGLETAARVARSRNGATSFGRVRGIVLLLGCSTLLWSSVTRAADASDWPHRTAAERSTITTVIDTHETVKLLDLLRQGKRQKAEDVLFAMLGLRLMDINDPNGSFSAGERKELCKQLGPLQKLETSRMFASLSRRDAKQASYLRSDIAVLRKKCMSRKQNLKAPEKMKH